MLDETLRGPDQVALAQAAARLEHPRLRPVTVDFAKPLTEDALAVIAVLANPELKALRVQEKVAQAQVFAAGLLPDPQFSAGMDVPISGAGDLVTGHTFGLNWDLAGLVTRPAEKRIAQAHARQVHYDIAWQEWLIANQARLLVRQIQYLERQVTIAREAAEIARRLVEQTRLNMTAGDARLDDLGLRQVAYLDAQDRALALTRDLTRVHLDLNKVLGLPPDRRLALAETTIPPQPRKGAEGLFADACRQRLDLIALKAGYDSQEAGVYRAVLGQYPRFSLGLNAMRDTSDVHTLGPAVSLDIPLINRNRGAIATAEATREQLHEEYSARLYQTRADIAALLADIEQITQEREALARELPELQQTEASLRAAVTSGDTTPANYEAVRASLLDKRLKAISLEQSAAEQQVALQIAIGAPLGP